MKGNHETAREGTEEAIYVQDFLMFLCFFHMLSSN